MKKMSKIEIRMPRLKLGIPVVLRSLLAILVLAEILTLFKLIYLDYREIAAAPSINANVYEVEFDEQKFQEVHFWIEKNRAFEIPEYILEDKETGREKPFAEYK